MAFTDLLIHNKYVFNQASILYTITVLLILGLDFAALTESTAVDLFSLGLLKLHFKIGD